MTLPNRAPGSPSVPATTVAGRLSPVRCIGFTGCLGAGGEPRVRAAIRKFLLDQKTDPAHSLCGVSSLTTSAELLFAECCLELDIALRLLLPLDQLKGRDNLSAAERAQAETIFGAALSVELVGKDEPQEELVYECGLQTVQQSHMLLALWDGRPSPELGGPANIVNFAARMGRAVVWIHEAAGTTETLQHHAVADPAADELKFLNALPTIGEAASSGGGKTEAETWLRKLDENASEVAPQVRRMAAIPILCTALAAFVTAAAQRLHAPGLWVSAGALLGLIAAISPMALRISKRQALWVRIRTAAEISRSFIALWSTPGRYQIVSPEILPELNGMLASLNVLKAKHARSEALEVTAFIAEYVRLRVQDQRNYFVQQAEKSAKQAVRYRWVGRIAGVCAIGMAVWAFVGHSVLKTSTSLSGGAWLPLVSSALFQVATVAGALVVVHDCDRRQRRYDQLSRSLERWEVELEAFHTWRPVMEVVTHIERALLAELLEWRSLLQTLKMPRN